MVQYFFLFRIFKTNKMLKSFEFNVDMKVALEQEKLYFIFGEMT